MKPYINISLICLSLLMASLPAMAQQGFTKKAEAKNELKKGLKYGKWVEYFDKYENATAGEPTYYRLTEYKDVSPSYEKLRKDYPNTTFLPYPPYGIQRMYFMNGVLYKEIPFATYDNGSEEKNGVEKRYYPSGKLRNESPYDHGVQKGEKEYYESGKLKVETPYERGKRNGVKKTYYENGQLQTEEPYTDYKENGVEKNYFEDGSLKDEMLYIDGTANGLRKTYKSAKSQNEDLQADGEKSRILSEAKNQLIAGVREGKWVEYFDNYWKATTDSATADNFLLTDYKGGKPFGTTRRYDKSGSLIQETPYTDGKENGIQKGYYGGKLNQEVPYTDGKIIGISKSYSSSGKLSRELPYTDGKINGMDKGYFEDGTISWELLYIDDQPTGVEKSYYRSGKLSGVTPYSNGKQNGMRKDYFESGKLQYEAPYIDGKKNGMVRYYYENGKLKYEIPYIDDKINGVETDYYEDGTISVKTPYTDGKKNLQARDILNNHILTLNNYIIGQQHLNMEDDVRKTIIAMVDTMTPPPAIPEEATRHLVMGKTAAKMATDASGYADAIAEFKSATLAAPWLGIAYFNLAVVQESAHDYTSAIQNYNYYLLAAPNAPDASDVKTRLYELEYKAKKQGEQDQIAAVDEAKKKQTRQVLDRLKTITGNTEYWWFFASIGDYTKGGRTGLNMSEFENSGKHWWDFGVWRSVYLFKDDKVYICPYNDLNPDKASLIGTPNGPRIDDISWEAAEYAGASGKLLSKKPLWVHINESNGDIYFSGNRPLTNPDRNAFYNYWWYSRK